MHAIDFYLAGEDGAEIAFTKRTGHGIFEDVAITDSLWILAFGINGLVGLVSLITSLMLPVISFCFSSYPVKTWFDPKVASAAVLAVVLLLFLLDSLLNNMFNPVFPLIAGGLSGLVLKEKANAKVKTNSKYSTKNQRYKNRQSKLNDLDIGL